MTKDYQLINLYGLPYIKLHKGPYLDTTFSYGDVSLIEESDHLRLKFQLSVVEGDINLEDNDQFIQYAGSILEELIRMNLA